MDGTPEPILADVVEPLGQHMRQKAPHELVGGQGHRLPALSLGVPVAEAENPLDSSTLTYAIQAPSDACESATSRSLTS